MPVEILSDPIEVTAHFGQRGMRPVWFAWQGRRREVRAVTGAWSERDGSVVHRCFAVTDGQAVYELRFDGRSLQWHLMKIALAG
jgi:hypothetical protein